MNLGLTYYDRDQGLSMCLQGSSLCTVERLLNHHLVRMLFESDLHLMVAPSNCIPPSPPIVTGSVGPVFMRK